MLPTLRDLIIISERIGVALSAGNESFDLDADEPPLHMSYTRDQKGIIAAFVRLARYEENLNSMKKKARDKR